MKRLCLLAFFPLVFAAAAQDGGAGDAAAEKQYRETQALIERMQAKIKSINTSATAREQDIEFLNKKIEEAIRMISSGSQENTDLRDANTGFQEELKDLYAKEGDLTDKLTAVTSERDSQVADLESRIASLGERLSAENRATVDLRDEVRTLTARLQSAQEGKAGVETALAEARRTASAHQGRLAALVEEVDVLKEKMRSSRDKAVEQEAEVAELNRRLKAALAAKGEDLSGYRSEFFGRLRQALGGRQDIRMVGDRFVFQSEVLFASGKAELDPRGQATLGQLARTLTEVTRKIPADLNWILRVDGHTDRLPIRTDHWKSNWELSTARALSVVEFLIEQRVPPHRLAATGFGKFQPLDPRDDEIAYRRNRRIEFKLTER